MHLHVGLAEGLGRLGELLVELGEVALFDDRPLLAWRVRRRIWSDHRRVSKWAYFVGSNVITEGSEIFFVDFACD